MEDEQLKASWACFAPLATSLATERLQTGTHENQMQMGKRVEVLESRRNLIKAFWSSITEKVEGGCKKEEAPPSET